MRASVSLTGLVLLVGGYAVLLLLAQSALRGDGLAGGSRADRSFVSNWGSAPPGEGTAANARTASVSAISFNQDPTGVRVSTGLGQRQQEPTASALTRSSLSIEMLQGTAERVGLAAGLTWLICLSAAAALLRRA